jgi:hypothetical protein
MKRTRYLTTKKRKYEALQAGVRRVFLEEMMAVSCTIPAGSEVYYEDYDEIPVESTKKEDTIIF